MQAGLSQGRDDCGGRGAGGGGSCRQGPVSVTGVAWWCVARVNQIQWVPTRGGHSFSFPLNLSSLCPPYNPTQPMDVNRRCSNSALT